MAGPVPALPPPPGVVSNFENPPSLAYQSNLVIGICTPTVTLFFLMRSYARICLRRTWLVEDWLAFTAWGGTVAYMGIMAATMAHHGGQHAWDITVPEAQEAAYWFNVASIEYGVMICITKIAVLCLYRRVFTPRCWRAFDLAIVGLIVVLSLFYGITSFIKIFECTPRARIVDKKIPGSCINVSTLLNVSGGFNTVTDFLILLLPVKAVWNLQMKKHKKLVVVLVFTFGLCAPVFSLIGFIVRFRISGNPDTTWNQPEILLWGAAELSTGNMCVCFPEIGPLFKRRQQKGPTTSILNGKHLRSRPLRPSRRGGDSLHVATLRSKGEDVSYLELSEDSTYGVHIAPGDGKPTDPAKDGGVHVSDEVWIESYRVPA